MSSNLNTASISKSLRDLGGKFAKYRVLLFMLLLVGIYGFIIFRIYTLAGIAPDENAVQATTKATRAHIDEDVAKKIQELQDNSVNVKSLFEEGRQNPFKE